MERSLTSEHYVGERDIGFIKGIGITAVGFVLALTRLFGLPAPFAAAGIAALGGIECVFMFVGAAAGYVINGGLEVCVPYITAMGALTVLRLAVSSFAPGKRSGLFRVVTSIAAGAAVLAANIFTSHGVYELFVSAAFSVVSAVFAYCADRLRSSGIRSIFAEHKAAGYIAGCVIFVLLTAALTSLEIGFINVGVFISVLFVLYSSEMRTGAASAVLAVLSTAGIAAGSPDLAASAIMISVAAPVIMLLGRYGRITRACVYILIVGTGLIITGMTDLNAAAAMSASAAAIAYMIVPGRFTPFSVVLGRETGERTYSPFAAFGRKLGTMSFAIDEMRSAVIRTSKALEAENFRDITWVSTKTADEVCKNCHSNMKCWGKLYNDTADIMNKALDQLKNGGFIGAEQLGGHLKSDCPERHRLAASLNRQYAVYCSAENTSRKIAEMRDILTGQLDATGTMLRKMSEELAGNDTCDAEAAGTAEIVLSEAGLSDAAVIAVMIGGKLGIDAYGSGSINISREELSDRLAVALHRELDLPVISETGGRTHITVSERARYDADIKVFRKSKDGNRHSGDCTECFNDGRGNVYMILSDGMGSGSRARIDSAFSCGMLSKLLKAGIDLEASLEMINSSLLVKSSDESFATLDLCRIDLNNGDVLLCKAGGAATYIRCGNTFAQTDGEGLPLGVGHKADYKCKLFRLSEGDVIIMASDGAELDKKWLEQVIMRDKHADIDKIIDTVGEALRLSADKETEDDITVIGVKLTR